MLGDAWQRADAIMLAIGYSKDPLRAHEYARLIVQRAFRRNHRQAVRRDAIERADLGGEA